LLVFPDVKLIVEVDLNFPGIGSDFDHRTAASSGSARQFFEVCFAFSNPHDSERRPSHHASRYAFVAASAAALCFPHRASICARTLKASAWKSGYGRAPLVPKHPPANRARH